jgi:hypothetical protein
MGPNVRMFVVCLCTLLDFLIIMKLLWNIKYGPLLLMCKIPITSPVDPIGYPFSRCSANLKLTLLFRKEYARFLNLCVTRNFLPTFSKCTYNTVSLLNTNNNSIPEMILTLHKL